MEGQITAKNYASQVEAYVEKYTPYDFDEFSSEFRDALMADWDLHALSIKKSVHFSMPDSATIFDDDLKGLDGSEEYRLPYSQISIECYDTRAKNPRKRLILAKETNSEDEIISNNNYFSQLIEDKLIDLDQRFLLIRSISSYEKGIWTTTPFLSIKPIDQHGPKSAIAIPRSEAHLAMCGWISLGRPDKFDQAAIPEEQYKKQIDYVWDLGKRASLDDTCLAMELVEALSCTNVESEPYRNIGPSTKRKKGKKSLYETRRLVLKRPDTVTGGGVSGEHKGFVRAHLRRGHIRRLKNPNRNIWVNACAVGNVKNGFVHKDYGVLGA